MITKASIQNLLEVYSKEYQDTHIEKTQTFVSNNENLFGRDNLSGQITGSAWILNKNEDKALLIHHKKLGLWFQPGGHVDAEDRTIIDTAQREAIEETGLKDVELLSPNLFDLDVHMIPERKGIPEHYHYDFRFIFKTSNDSFNADSREVNDIKWMTLKEITNNKEFGSIKRMAEKCQKYLH